MASTYCRLMFPNQMMPPTLEYSSTSIEHFFEGNLLEPARSGHQLFLAIAGFTTSCHWQRRIAVGILSPTLLITHNIYIYTIHLNQIPYMVFCAIIITNIRSGICLYWDRVKKMTCMYIQTYAQLHILYDIYIKLS